MDQAFFFVFNVVLPAKLRCAAKSSNICASYLWTWPSSRPPFHFGDGGIAQARLTSAMAAQTRGNLAPNLTFNTEQGGLGPGVPSGSSPISG